MHYHIKNMSPQLLVVDVENPIKFYTENLGFSMDFYYEDFYAGISKNSYSIHLKMSKSSVNEKENRRNNEDIHILFAVNDIEDLYKETIKQVS